MHAASRGEVLEEAEPPQHRQAQGGYPRERRALFRVRVHGREPLRAHAGPRSKFPGAQDPQHHVPDNASDRLHAQARLLPPRHQAGEHTHQGKGTNQQPGRHRQGGRLRPGARNPLAPALHGVRVDEVVPGAGGLDAIHALQLADRHVGVRVHYGGALCPGSPVPGHKRGRSGVQDLLRARNAYGRDVARGPQAGGADAIPVPPLRANPLGAAHPKR
ncbi:unnamed protein product [Ectocarpus fasciculatus]